MGSCQIESLAGARFDVCGCELLLDVSGTGKGFVECDRAKQTAAQDLVEMKVWLGEGRSRKTLYDQVLSP